MHFNDLRHRLVHVMAGYDKEVRLLLLSIIVGVIGAIAAIIFRLSILYIFLSFNFLFRWITYSKVTSVIIPTFGGFIVGTIIYYSANEARGHGIPEMVKSISLDHGRMRARVPFVELIASAVTIGSGGSSGREGPIAYVSGALGSFVARFFDLKDEEIKTLALAGVASGISATFNAPIGGVLFGIEIVRRDQKNFNLLPLITSSVIGVSIAEFFLGQQPAFTFPTELVYTSGNWFNILLFIVLGLLVGVISVIWILSFYFIGDFLHKFKLSPILLATLGGFFVGIISIFFPEVSGVNYDPINSAFALQYTLQFVLILFIVKLIATSITLGSGMSGGVSAPTLYLGVMIGTAFGFIAHFLNLTNSPIVLFAFLGMAALFAGTMRAPLTSVVLMSEMVNDFQLIIPLMFAVSVAWIISRSIMKEDIFTLKLQRMGLEISEDVDILEHLSVENIMTTKIDMVSPMDRLETVLQLMQETGHTGFPVVEDNKLVGIITEHDVDNALHKKEMKDWIVREICTKHVTSIVRTCPVSVAFLLMVDQEINRFPVTESKDDHTLVGWVTRSDLMKAYRLIKADLKLQEHENKLFEEVLSGELKLR